MDSYTLTPFQPSTFTEISVEHAKPAPYYAADHCSDTFRALVEQATSCGSYLSHFTGPGFACAATTLLTFRQLWRGLSACQLVLR